jgi:hypothetical protein
MGIKDQAAWLPAKYELADLSAVQALANGLADEYQQKRALKWIIENVCGTYQLSYRPTSDRDTAFAEGRRFVGLQIVKALHLSTSTLKELAEK